MKISDRFYNVCEKALFAKHATLKLTAGYLVAVAIAVVIMILFL